jgi:hypothetical protein
MPQILAVGPWQLREFSMVRHEIDPMSSWPICQTLKQAATLLEQKEVAPELLLLAQPRPGYYVQSLLEHLQRLAPLTRIVLVAGSWCEGELRTGQPARGVLRLYWYDLAAWWRDAMACQAAGGCTPWSEPQEDGYAQRLRKNTSQSGPVQTRADCLIEVDTLEYETFATLAALLTSVGWSAVWQRRSLRPITTAGTAAGIWDGGQFDPPEIDQLARFCQSLKKCAGCLVPVIVLLDFPRSEHISMAQAAGARTVLPKPYRMDDLLSMLRAASST